MHRFSRSRLVAIASMAFCTSSLSQKLYAQTDTAARADTTRRAQLPRMVITAQRRVETTQDVGLAVTALRGDQLSERGIARPSDVQRVVPSLEIEPAFGGGQPQYRLRGVGFSDYAANNSATVAVYVDNVALPFPVQTQGVLFDLERVEVLRGPQGSLYGRNSTAGAVNYLSRRPTAERHGALAVDVGSFGAVNAEGFLSGTVAERVRGRVAVATQQGGAWQHDRVSGAALGARDVSAMRTQLEWDATPRVTLLLSATAAHDASDAQGLYLFAPFATNGGAGTTISADEDRRATGWGLRAPFASLLGVSPSAKPGRNNINGGAQVQARAQFGGAELTSITAFNALHRRETGDWDASASAESDEAFQSHIGSFSQEFRLASRPAAGAGAGRVDWLTGLYHSDERINERFYSDFTNVPTIGAAALTSYRQLAAATALFGQLGWRIAPRWKLVLGARAEYELRELMDLTTGFVTPPVAFVPPTNRTLIARQPSGRFAVEFTPAARVLTYASVSRGVKSGGFTAYNTTNPAQLDAFAPEVLNAVELGIKSEPSRRVRANAAVYHYQYLNQQVLSTVYDQVSHGPIGRIANAKRSRIDGAEVELEWQVTPQLSVSQFGGVVAGRYQEFATVDAQASIAAGREVTREFSGTSLNIPRLSLGGSAAYDWRVGRVQFRASANYSTRDRQQASRLIFTPEYDVAGYSLVNATLSVAPIGSHWSAQLWARNVTNRQYDVTRNFFINAKVAAAGMPATAGLRLSFAR